MQIGGVGVGDWERGGLIGDWEKMIEDLGTVVSGRTGEVEVFRVSFPQDLIGDLMEGERVLLVFVVMSNGSGLFINSKLLTCKVIKRSNADYAHNKYNPHYNCIITHGQAISLFSMRSPNKNAYAGA